MDVLSDILGKIKLTSVVYFKSDFSIPWGMNIPKGPFAQFHIVTKGHCILQSRDQSIQLSAGDIVMFPLGTNHWLADSKNSRLESGYEVVQSILNGSSMFTGDNISTTLICGHFEFDKSFEHPLIKELPEIIHIKNEEKKDLPWLKSLSDLLIQETGSEKEGSNVIIKKLGEVLFIHTLRAYIQRSNHKKGFMASIQDEKISKALKVIHSSPEKNWQLSSLAQVSGMSRTAFSNRFKELLGDTPLEYITQWRILQAKELLMESKFSVGQICENVGYNSKAAFNRVFKSKVGLTPLKFRQSLLVS